MFEGGFDGKHEISGHDVFSLKLQWRGNCVNCIVVTIYNVHVRGSLHVLVLIIQLFDYVDVVLVSNTTDFHKPHEDIVQNYEILANQNNLAFFATAVLLSKYLESIGALRSTVLCPYE